MTNEQNIIAVPVPVDAYNIEYTAGKKWGYPYSTLYYTRGGFRHHAHIDSFNGEGTFLGCVSFKDGVYDIPFDPEPFLKGPDPVNGLFEVVGSTHTVDSWVNSGGELNTLNRTEYVQAKPAFISLLQSMGHYWVNPLGEEPRPLDAKYIVFDGNDYDRDQWAKDHKSWRAAQEKCLRPDQKLAVMKIGG